MRARPWGMLGPCKTCRWSPRVMFSLRVLWAACTLRKHLPFVTAATARIVVAEEKAAKDKEAERLAKEIDDRVSMAKDWLHSTLNPPASFVWPVVHETRSSDGPPGARSTTASPTHPRPHEHEPLPRAITMFATNPNHDHPEFDRMCIVFRDVPDSCSPYITLRTCQ